MFYLAEHTAPRAAPSIVDATPSGGVSFTPIGIREYFIPSADLAVIILVRIITEKAHYILYKHKKLGTRFI